jgi:hypothetical protein
MFSWPFGPLSTLPACRRIGYWLLAIAYRLLAIGYWLLAIGYWLLAIGIAAAAPLAKHMMGEAHSQ